MNEREPSSSRRWLSLACLPLLSLPLAALLCFGSDYRALADPADDIQLRLAAPAHRYEEVLAIDIDDASLRALQPRLGGWPYGRDVYALALGYLREAGAKLVVFDIVFSGARSGDAALARTLQARPDAVLAAAGLRQTLEIDRLESSLLERLSAPLSPGVPATRWPALSLPSESLQPPAIGIVSVPLDPDGRLRRFPLLHESQGREPRFRI